MTSAIPCLQSERNNNMKKFRTSIALCTAVCKVFCCHSFSKDASNVKIEYKIFMKTEGRQGQRDGTETKEDTGWRRGSTLRLLSGRGRFFCGSYLPEFDSGRKGCLADFLYESAGTDYGGGDRGLARHTRQGSELFSAPEGCARGREPGQLEGSAERRLLVRVAGRDFSAT